MYVIKMKKILITGSSGLLGQKITDKLSGLFNVLSLSRFGSGGCLDITSKDAVYNTFKEFKPDIVINCAAFTDVDRSETEKSLARDVNVKGLTNIIGSLPNNSKIIHISTDYIFDGESGCYKEDDMKNPINYYGKTKLEADNLLMGSNCNYLIIRPNVLYSYDNVFNQSPKDNYNQHFLSWLIYSLSNNDNVKVVDDQISNPVYIPDLVNVIITSVLVDYSGISHYGSEDVLSRYEFAIKVCNIFGFDSGKILAIKSDELNQIALRPKKSSLDCSKIVQDLNIDLYSTDYSLNRIYSKQ
tara:strand:+ start:614 stop:1510 length:897 start_codon:yes stop_codon:yes gene_type:complete